MDALRRVLANIARELGRLSATQKMLILSLVALMASALFVIFLWTSKPAMVELLPGQPADDQQRAASFVQARNIPHRVAPGGVVMVPAEQRLLTLGQMGQEGALPDDTTVLFNNLASKRSWTMSREDARQLETAALQNELNLVISQFRGVRKASVIIDVPPPSGLGMAARRPTASVTVFTAGGPMDQDTVDAVANLVASARAGLDVESVRVIDGSNNRQRRARTDENAGATTYLEHAGLVEDRTRERLLSLLSYVPGVVVAVNAQVDVRRAVMETSKVLDPGKGTVTAPARETTLERVDAQASRGAEPGVRSNVGLDINRAGAGGSQSTETKSEAEMTTQFGRMTERVVDPRGMPLKINATINIPRSYFAGLWRRSQGANAAAAEPTDADVQTVAQAEIARIRGDVLPQVDASATGQGSAGEVVVSMIPDTDPALGVSGSAIAGAPGAVGSLMLMSGGWLKTAGLGALAIVALGMMFMMLRRAAKTDAPLPTAQEMVGVPPALQKLNDLIGEADEAESALAGIELSDDVIKSRKLAEQVQELVKSKPEEAASLLNRWIQTES